MKYKYIIIGRGDYYERIFDCGDSNRNYLYCSNKFVKWKEKHVFLSKVITRISNSRHINERIRFFFRSIIYGIECDYRKVYNDSPIFILLQNCKYAQDFKFLQYLRQRFDNPKVCIWLTNTIESCPVDIKLLKNEYDLVITISKKDSVNFRLFFHNLCYRSYHNQSHTNSLEYDLFFCGADKGRRTSIENLFLFLTSKGVKCCFIIKVDSVPQKKVTGIHYITSNLQYDEVTKYIYASKTILEVISGKDNTDYLTLRYFEAIVYHKKLLSTNTTNNITISEGLVLNKNQIMLFSNKEDIDINWIKSPLSIIDSINPEIISPECFLNDLSYYLDEMK